MALTSGTRLGPYEIATQLGAGGMGEVYRARDTRLERTVALKILPGHLAADPSFRARFEREAKSISALNHPHICSLYDIGEQDGVRFLVMEHLEGETLAQRLARGPLPVPEALAVAVPIASALAAAHRQGVVHRDLKPGNIMLTRAGAKLLDFGLAKQGPESVPPVSSVMMTQASPLTAQGTIVGTWQYLSPEQLEGGEADTRSDIFSFGAVLYEMLTGQRAFAGRSQASLIAAIMGSDPPGLAALATSTSPALARLTRRCLAKDPEARWQTAADLESELRWIEEERTRQPGASEGGIPAPATGPTSGAYAAPAAAARGTATRERIAWAGLAVALAALAVFLATRERPREATPLRPVRSALAAPSGARFDNRFAPAVSPDGTRVAMVIVEGSEPMLWIRDLSSPEFRKLPETAGAAHPFWSPDGRWIGFFAQAKLKKIGADGGPAIPLCAAADGRGGSWSADGTIVFEPRYSDPLHVVPAAGGTSQPLTTLDESRAEISHRWPHFLPDGKRFLFFVVSTTNPSLSEHSGVYAGTLGSSEKRKVLGVNSKVAFVDGHLIYRQGSTLMAHAFDPAALQVRGDPRPLASELAGGAYSWGGAEFGAAGGGVIVFLAGGAEGDTDLVWYDRAGARMGQLGERGQHWDPDISHDGRRVVVGIGLDASDLWLHDLERDVRTRFTFDPADDTSASWSPDDSRIAFTSARKGFGEVYVKETSGTAEEELLFEAGAQVSTQGWSPDGRLLVVSVVNRETGADLWTYSFDGRKAEPWLVRPGDQFSARISPDGRWIAYDSDESSRSEVYVQSFPSPAGGRWQVSQAGGQHPRWSRNGKEIYFLDPGGGVMALGVQPGPAFHPGTPRKLFSSTARLSIGPPYAVVGDGERFLINEIVGGSTAGTGAELILNWTAALRP